jgi:hypothetical protein
MDSDFLVIPLIMLVWLLGLLGYGKVFTRSRKKP